MAVGAIGAIFYAYFFYALLPWRPVVQGLAFGLLAAVPVTVAVYPLLIVMHASADVAQMNLMGFGHMLGWRERWGLVLGHLIYGAVLGALYTRPVGRSTARLPDLGPDIHRRPRCPSAKPVEAPPDGSFIFASGIECSYPTLENGRWRLDQMEATGHYRHWREDLALTAETGVTHLRYGPPLHLVCVGPGKYDWSFTDAVMPEMQRLGSRRSSTSATSACRTGWRTSRTRKSPTRSAPMRGRLRSAIPGCGSTRP